MTEKRRAEILSEMDAIKQAGIDIVDEFDPKLHPHLYALLDELLDRYSSLRDELEN